MNVQNWDKYGLSRYCFFCCKGGCNLSGGDQNKTVKNKRGNELIHNPSNKDELWNQFQTFLKSSSGSPSGNKSSSGAPSGNKSSSGAPSGKKPSSNFVTLEGQIPNFNSLKKEKKDAINILLKGKETGIIVDGKPTYEKNVFIPILALLKKK